MILLCGIPSEPPLRSAIEAAEDAQIPHVVLNQRESQYTEVAFDISQGQVTGTLSVRETDWPLEEFTGVYVRLMDWQSLPEVRPMPRRLSNPDVTERIRFLHEFLGYWLELTSGRICNRNSASVSNISKPFQSQYILRSGLKIPATLVTNDPQEVLSFLAIHKRVVYKSVSSVRSIVKELQAEELKDLVRVRVLPTQFQAFVPGTNIRVHTF